MHLQHQPNILDIFICIVSNLVCIYFGYSISNLMLQSLILYYIVVNHPCQVQQTQTGRSVKTLLAESLYVKNGYNSIFLLGASASSSGGLPSILYLQFVISLSSL